MRYVIGICIVAFFLIWDGLYNEGRYLDYSIKEVRHVISLATG